MLSSYYKSIRSGPFSLRSSKHQRRRFAPMLVWLMALVVAGSLYLRQESGLSISGFAENLSCTVSPENGGRLQGVEVLLNQDVVVGQVLAVFESDELMLALQSARIELGRITKSLDREKALWEMDQATQQMDQQANHRRFARDVANAHIEHLNALAEMAEDKIVLQGLELKLGRSQKLGQGGLVSVSSLDETRIAHDALKTKILQQESTLLQLLAAHEGAIERFDKFQIETPEPPLGPGLFLKPFEMAIKGQELQIELVNLAMNKRILRAPIAGRIAEIFSSSGEVVATGEAVLTIVKHRAQELVAYLPEDRILALRAGDEVVVRRLAEWGKAYPCTVVSLGARVQEIPLRAEPLRSGSSWGLEVRISLPDQLAVKPGEGFRVSFFMRP